MLSAQNPHNIRLRRSILQAKELTGVFSGQGSVVRVQGPAPGLDSVPLDGLGFESQTGTIVRLGPVMICKTGVRDQGSGKERAVGVRGRPPSVLGPVRGGAPGWGPRWEKATWLHEFCKEQNRKCCSSGVHLLWFRCSQKDPSLLLHSRKLQIYAGKFLAAARNICLD